MLSKLNPARDCRYPLSKYMITAAVKSSAPEYNNGHHRRRNRGEERAGLTIVGRRYHRTIRHDRARKTRYEEDPCGRCNVILRRPSLPPAHKSNDDSLSNYGKSTPSSRLSSASSSSRRCHHYHYRHASPLSRHRHRHRCRHHCHRSPSNGENFYSFLTEVSVPIRFEIRFFTF